MNRAGRKTSPRQRRGLVLVLVLVVIAMLCLAGYTFSELMLSERKAAMAVVGQAQARALAESGIDYARHFAALFQDEQDEQGGWYDNPDRFRGVMVADDADARRRGRFTLIAPALQEGIAVGDRYGLENESARLNLASVLRVANTQSAAMAAAATTELNAAGGVPDDAMESASLGRQMLMGLPGMTEDTADAILDWIDADDETREFGAESDYYAAMERPYATRNTLPVTIEELLLVRGVTPELLFGGDLNRNGRLDPDEPSMDAMENFDNADGAMNCGWAAYLTLYSAESTRKPDGTARINVNASDLESLQSDLEAVNADWATFVIAARRYGVKSGQPPPNATLTNQLPDGEAQAANQIKSLMDLVDAYVQLPTPSDGSKPPPQQIIPSPFTSVDSESLAAMMEELTTTAETTIPGRINIHQAPEAVLACIPGMTAETVDAILSNRVENPVEQAEERRSITWLLAEGVVELAQLKQMEPYITTGGSVFRAQAVGHFDGPGPSARIEAVFDATQRPAKVVFWRDISHLPFNMSGFGAESSEP